jgi:hypothetical protein
MITQVARTDGLALRAAVLGLLDLKRLLAQEDECDELTYTSNKRDSVEVRNDRLSRGPALEPHLMLGRVNDL